MPSVYEVGIPSTAAAEGPSYPLLAPGLPIPPSVSDAKVAGCVTIGEIGPRVFAFEGQVQVMASQMVHAADSCAVARHTDSAAADYGLKDEQSFLRWVEAEWLVSRLKMRNEEDFSYIRCVLPLMYQLMALKKTSFPEMEYSGSVVASIPDVVEDQNKALSDT
ncbi:hypothetical protein Tco_0621180 [Tanacetum coccineum]